ncbi:1,4-alpha-glucan branching protein GlgB [Legionella jordanis]|uniref:1,4-alpha-glucan branching enzyme GlgB n=1 Tax=Legionella jordanis TaxID=456 RepID=A0A0W0VAE9_9GAMM|nr:1,4-alpha-glucan branching protein GlgB [Legionella jordanis]KTD17125.1 1,4-alpha-glucan branching enzyme GlgB [Legionella jordanis]VEH12678.1 1,4-alpha-glucan branching enzyme GlgB [Legionella jordanis]
MKKDSQQKVEALQQLAEFAGILTSYENAWGETVQAPTNTILAILSALGISIEHDSQASSILEQLQKKARDNKLDEIILLWDGLGKTVPIPLCEDEINQLAHAEILQEDGSSISKLKLSKAKKNQHDQLIRSLVIPKLSWGYHLLKLNLGKREFTSLVLSAPRKMYRPEKFNYEKEYGLFCPIYALHSEHSIGCGDLNDFMQLAKWLNEHQGQLVATTPLFSVFLDEPCEPSPYSPISRLFGNELYLNLRAIADIPEEYQEEIASLNEEPIINYKKTAALKRRIAQQQFKLLLKDPAQKNELKSYLKKRPELKKYALFRAYMEHIGKPWEQWPDQQKNGEISEEDVSTEQYHYHLISQWQFEKQLSELRNNLNKNQQRLYLDLPVGSHGWGFDVWHHQDNYLLKTAVGAPPDPMFLKGQNWQLPPLNPIKLRENRYKQLIQLFDHVMQQVDVLRIDHVMAFNRLYIIPKGFESSEGVYLRYPTDEIYAILAIESHRHKVIVVGENLGSVPPQTNRMMRRHGLMEMHILQYALESKQNPVPKSNNLLASLNTHDMPTFYAFCHELDIKKYQELGLISADYAQAMTKKRRRQLKTLKTTLVNYLPDENNLLKASLSMLAKSQAPLFVINIEDLWEEKQSQNVPTANSEPNWRRKLAYSMEQITQMAEVSNLLYFIGKNQKPIKESPQQASLLSDMDLYLFNEGRHYRLYNHLGAHPGTVDHINGVHFAVWAPNASYVSVIGSFNHWNRDSNPLSSLGNSGVWQGFVPAAQCGDLYKYFIHSERTNFTAEKSDPFAFYHEVPPCTASVVWESKHQWQDDAWLKKRKEKQSLQAPISIYEVHLGSWRRVPEDNNRYLSYREMAPMLADYVQSMGFTHVEFLPVMEHPFYGSWGYQTLSYFAPTARYGTPDDFMFLIDYLHQHEIGVILDWVPSHFPNDEHGLARFDGTHLFEHFDARKGFHPDWKSAIFNYGRNEVQAFLISSALYWLDKFHIDAIRVDAVASMLYLNYSRADGEWLPNQFGGKENLEAIHFLKTLNTVLYGYYPDIQTFAEESTAWSGVSSPVETGGLGFGFKWDMGWMHDTLLYFAKDPIHRRFHQHQLSFRMVYAFTENFTLSLSHDEVVYGKGSLINKMPGDNYQKFANLRLLYGYMFSLPGKKLLFMGCEFAQFSEWSHESSLDWHLLDYPMHQKLQTWVRDLNVLYRNEAALHELDCQREGFEWIDCNDADNSIYSFLRKSINGELLLVLMNCTPVTRTLYRLGVPRAGSWQEIITSNDEKYGGDKWASRECLTTEDMPYHGHPYSLNLIVDGLSLAIYKWLS